MIGEEQHITNNNNNNNNNSDLLKQHVLINHFTNATGCNNEQAAQLLTQCAWNFEMALSLFFQETTIAGQHSSCQGINPLCAPCNTPATPPSFESALAALSKLGCTTPVDTRGVLHNANIVASPTQRYTPPLDEECAMEAEQPSAAPNDWMTENRLHHVSQPRQIAHMQHQY
jgi:hypothetical protein